jgi:hypothetical protein
MEVACVLSCFADKGAYLIFMGCNFYDSRAINEAINKKRDEMIKIGMAKGLIYEETVKYSQELDHLLNQYHVILNKLVETKRPTENY